MAADTPSPSADAQRAVGDPRQSLNDPFDTLGFEPTFELDPKELEARQRELSRALHPDRYVGRPSSERAQALGRAIEVNDAARALGDPIRRAEALLARLGHPVSEANAQPATPELLLEVMERREALGEARRRRDLGAVRALSRSVRARQELVSAALAAGFRAESLDVSRALSLLGELRYHRRFLEEAGAIEDDLDGASP